MSEQTRAWLLDALVRYDKLHGEYPESQYEGEAVFTFLVDYVGEIVTPEERARFAAVKQELVDELAAIGLLRVRGATRRMESPK